MSPLPMFSDEADAFLTARRGWVSRRSWDDHAIQDEWIFVPSVGLAAQPIRIECDGYGFVAWGLSYRLDQDGLTGERRRLYSVEELKATIEEIESWLS